MKQKVEPKEAYDEMREYCLAKEGAVEDRPWGDVAWKKGKKAFVFTNEGSSRYTLKNTPDRQSVLILHPQIKVAAYVGRFGWVTIEVVDDDSLALAKELADEAFDLIGPPRKTKQ